MAHYAFLDKNNIVTEVIVGMDEWIDNIDWEQHYGNFRGQVCKRTSYNTQYGQHKNGGIPYRKNYAGIGYFYDEERDAFIPPKPFNSWLLDEETCRWSPPIEKPSQLSEDQILSGLFYRWDEDLYQTDKTKGWVLGTISQIN